jgi:Flp pilus assembly protein TadG
MKPEKKSQRGNALLEFALGFSLLWALFAGVYQFGYTFFIYNRLMTAVTNAAAVGSKLTYDTGNTSQFTDAVTNMVLYGSTTAGTSSIVPGLSSSNVSVSVNAQNSIPTNVTIAINNFTVDALFKTFAFNGKPSVTMAYIGQIRCSTC